MSLADQIPNNVDLSDDPRLMRALTRWQPEFLDWWRSMGPEGFDTHQVWLRTAVSVNASGWAHYDYVRMSEYRWGIFLAPVHNDTYIGFGDELGKRTWDQVPGELRAPLRRILVTQADTEPASVEQQRLLGSTAPSLYDMRNLFQVNVEEARHLWAMVHLLHQFFGRDGREEAERLLQRRSGDPDRPRILDTFNERTDEWLSFFMFTTFTDRDGKFQLSALSESGFEPLARATRFMLTEEAFHLYNGESGIDRVLMRTAQLMRQHGDNVRENGGIDLPTIQRYLNFWYSSSLDLFGSEDSTNAADWFATGLKGRHRERRYEDHTGLEQVYNLEVFEGGKWTTREVPLRRALNEVLREEYRTDCQRVVDRWNRTLEECGLSERLFLPSSRFNRKQGVYGGHHFTPQGDTVSKDEFETRFRDEWIPSQADRDYVVSLMQPVTEPGQYAGWISPPRKGLRDKPHDFPYVVPPQ